MFSAPFKPAFLRNHTLYPHRIALQNLLSALVSPTTQFCADPWLAKAKKRIGRATSPDIHIASPSGIIYTWTAEPQFYLDVTFGGDELHITFAHLGSDYRTLLKVAI
jgi:hypothetical protein